MKLVVVTYGTEGDTRPMAALSRALMDAGHQVRLLADGSTLGPTRTLGVPATALSGDIRETLSKAIGGDGGFQDTTKALAQIANTNTAAWMRELVDASEGCDVVVVSGLTAFVGLSVAEYRRVPVIGTGLIPITPTAGFLSPFLPPGKVPRWFNRASHRLVNSLLWQAFRKSTNAARASVCGLPPRKRVWTEHPMLYGVSPNLLSQPRDWPANARACGQWNVPDAAWEPPPALGRFLAAGEAPIYVGFGSMAGFDRTRMLDALVTAIAGRRALFYPGWSGMDGASLPDNFHVIDDTPHDWLFPRTALVIHHGGSGTTHSAARAGVPSVVVPFAGDQFFWADRLRHLGVAGKPVMGRRPQASALAQGIAYAQRDDVRDRARVLGERMASEDGLADAVAAIHALMR